MALSNTYDQTNPGSAVSNREQLTEIFSVLEPEKTPIISSLDRRKATAMYVEVTMDKMRSPKTTGRAEGQDYTSYSNQHASRWRAGNYCQIFDDTYQVSRQQQAVESVGGSMLEEAQSKAMLQVKRDIEATVCSNNDRQQEDGAGNVYMLRALGDWIDSSGPDDIGEDFRSVAGAIETDASANFNETKLLNMIAELFRVTGDVNSLTLFADTTLRRTTSDFARLGDQTSTIRNVNYEGGASEIRTAVDLFKSDHGIISIVNANPDCMPPTTVPGWGGYLLNLDYLCLHELLPLQMETLQDAGGGYRGFVDCTLTLTMKHPGAHGKITD